ncbi:MAG: hypothetical protein V5A28_04965 [Haloarculaceae archaeon]
MPEKAHSPPGPPVVGNVPKLAADPLRFLVGVQQAYGGRYPLVRVDPAVADGVTVVLDAELVHEILADRERFSVPAATFGAVGPSGRRFIGRSITRVDTSPTATPTRTPTGNHASESVPTTIAVTGIPCASVDVATTWV